MSFLSQNQITNPSKAVKLEQQTNFIKNISKRAYEDLVRTQKMGIDMLWNHPELTPQEIIDALGEDAIKIFQYHGALTEYVVALATAEGITPDIKLPTNAFTIENGVITVLDTPYVP